MTHRLPLAVLLAAVALPARSAKKDAEPDAPAPMPEGRWEEGKTKADQLCAGCHGPDGNTPVADWPRLADQNKDYLYEQIVAYRSGARPSPAMEPPVKDLTDQDAADIARWYARQASTSTAAGTELAARGRVLYFEGRPADHVPACVGCHGVRGRGYAEVIRGGFPAVAAQNSGYTALTLREYRAGTRKLDHNGMMRAAAAKLTDEEIQALAEFLAGQI